jgi:MSHA biogenesis protein MshI
VLRHCEFRACAPDAVANCLARMFDEVGLGRTPTSAVLPASGYQLVLVEAPDVLPAELKAAIRWRVKDMIDFGIEDAVIDVFEPPAPSRRQQQRLMYAIAARREVVQHTVDVMAPVAKGFDVIDVPELCLRNIAALLPADEQGLALLFQHGGTAELILTRAGKLYFSRHIDLSRHLAPDDGGLADHAALSLELQRSLDYYESHFDQPPINSLYVVPSDPRSEALAAGLGRESALRVAVADLAGLFDCASPPDASTQTHCLLAAGAALRLERTRL